MDCATPEFGHVHECQYGFNKKKKKKKKKTQKTNKQKNNNNKNKHNYTPCKYWWDDSLQAVSSGSVLVAQKTAFGRSSWKGYGLNF